MREISGQLAGLLTQSPSQKTLVPTVQASPPPQPTGNPLTPPSSCSETISLQAFPPGSTIEAKLFSPPVAPRETGARCHIPTCLWVCVLVPSAPLDCSCRKKAGRGCQTGKGAGSVAEAGEGRGLSSEESSGRAVPCGHRNVRQLGVEA